MYVFTLFSLTRSQILWKSEYHLRSWPWKLQRSTLVDRSRCPLCRIVVDDHGQLYSQESSLNRCRSWRVPPLSFRCPHPCPKNWVSYIFNIVIGVDILFRKSLLQFFASSFSLSLLWWSAFTKANSDYKEFSWIMLVDSSMNTPTLTCTSPYSCFSHSSGGLPSLSCMEPLPKTHRLIITTILLQEVSGASSPLLLWSLDLSS